MLRCINCHLCVDRMLRHVVSSIESALQTLLARWKSLQQLPPDAVICEECFLQLDQHCRNGNLNAERELGHTHVCLGCGRSVLETSRRVRYHTLEASDPLIATILTWDIIHNEVISRHAYVCHLCWMRASRQLSKDVRGQPATDARAELANQQVYPEQMPVPHQEIPVPPPLPPTQEQQSEVSSSRNEIKVFCPKCNTEVSHTAEGIQEDQTKILIAKVYHYFEQEYEELKKIYGDLDLTPLSKFRQRTALATGVSETTLLQILQEEEERNADKRREPPQKRRAARKRRRQTESSNEEGSSDDNVEDSEQPRHADETQTVEVKIEPACNDEEPDNSEMILPAEMKLEPSDGEIDNEEPEIFIPPVKMEPCDGDTDKEQTDPISLDVKPEPRDDEMDTTNETLALSDPDDRRRKVRRISRNSDDTSIQQHTEDESSTPGSSRSKLRESLEETAYNYPMADKPDEPMYLTDLPLPSRSNAPVETQDAAASTSATPFTEPPTIAAPKSSAQRQREYRQRIAASRTPEQSTATRISEAERKRNYRLRKAAKLGLASGSLESTTASPRSAGRSTDVQNSTQR